MSPPNARTLEQANARLEIQFIPWWNRTLCSCRLQQTHSPPVSLSCVEARLVADDYTIRFDTRTYQIARADVRAGLHGVEVRVTGRA